MAAAIPYIIMAASTAAAVYGDQQRSKAQRQQYEAQAAANAYNEAVLKQKAEETAAAYNQREEAQRRANRIERGKRVAMIAQSGTGFEGTNADVERQNDMLSELDALNVRYQGQLESQGLLAQANLEGRYGAMNRSSASTATRLGYISMAGDTLSGASRMYNYGRGGSGIPLGA